jgi:ADP-heptose:LPS heptosyltransferase
VLGPGASWDGKAWPVGRFREIARRIHERTGLAGIACGAAAEAGITAELCSGTTPPLADLGGKTSVRELVGLVAHAAFVVTNDTSIVHIAAAAGVPAVVILGGGHFGRFLPYSTDQAEATAPSVVHAAMPCFGCDWRCKFAPFDRGPKPCITNVSVDHVWHVVEAVLPATAFEATTRVEPMGAAPDARGGKRTRLSAP